MNCKSNKLRDAVVLALVVGVAGTGTAVAQEAGTTNLDKIEVTGSRIKRADVETSQPVFTMSRQQIESQGLTSIGDVIQNISSGGSALNSNVNNGGNGETRVNLRNLGSNRTLVLVNGRRWVGGTGLGGAVDLNTIPTAAVERIEVLKDGASTIYGSDAISGVVNIILRQNFDGAEANAYFGQYDKGDGSRESYDFTIGSTGDRWHATLGVGYVKEEPVWAGDREISSVPVFGAVRGTGNSTTIPGGRFGIFGPTGPDPTTGAPTFGATRFNGTPGFSITNNGGTTSRNYTAADSYNFAPANYLVTPQERKSVFADAGLSITDNVRFKTTVTYNERESSQILAPMPIVLGRSAPGTNGADIVISANNIYNNTGRDIDYIQYRAEETGGRIFTQNVKTFGFSGAFEGDFEVGQRFFSWEAGMFYGKNDQTDRTTGLFNISALRNALGPSFVDAGGVARCGTAASTIDGCVPMNMLSGPGSLTPEMLSYAGFNAHDLYGYEQKTYFGNIGGELFDLQGGAFAFSFGAEHREESGFDDPDALINSGDTTGNARTATNGGYKLDEAYLELAVPLLADLPGAQLLDFSLATRYSDYSNFGDTTNSKFGFRWKPITDLMIRGNWSQGFRAPSINELFQGVSDTFEDVRDPCAGSFSDGSVNGTRPGSCGAVPAYAQANPQVRTATGGNPNLQPETSTSKTLGFVFSPSWVTGLDISLDWWNIEIEDAIDTQTVQETLDSCYLAGVANACSLIQREPTGEVSNLLAVPNNIAKIEAEGYDLTVGYRLPDTAWGSFSVVWDSTYMSKFVVEKPLQDPETRVGLYRGGSAQDNNWRIRSNLMLNWELGDVGGSASMRYYSSQVENCTGANVATPANVALLCSDPDRVTAAGAAPRNHVPSVTYTDLAAYWKAPWNARVTVGVNNAFDRDPPQAATAFANSFDPQYEIPGRFYYMRYTQKF
ncbi:TonB-dependent receptor domain-containing protein [Xanthomonas hortorum]|uniref:Vitamin B12 transporter BtuB n=3 Tax=Gammaproteobacteria TaxID=1236 RepID=A0A6V7CGD4_9XANT|nr:TonB-dependent receptor [Xanthomonas hortorum]APP81460.1 TonB-dependent receptor [Xanthomonas hortorum pv. gardneri]EGD16983.1 TonB-dependent outer membrane receptor [Xanthomonas hortorum ATCC 19865]KLA93536.1 TonB-dependent receptor [Xanthomonas hortorum pv. gardneri]KLA99587.1 TonB-dependent receptor [Xanthomonas hortorum pv. gardneri]KLB03211.1 TonB-dependent receptor [Xanthomonas hortorum pv. gardneri]